MDMLVGRHAIFLEAGIRKKILGLNFRKKVQLFEPRHDKTNKVSVRPAKTQISLGIRPV